MFLLASFEQVSACVCGGNELCSDYNSTDLIFSGKVVAIGKSTKIVQFPNQEPINLEINEYKFSISETFQGNIKTSTISIFSEGTNCDFSFQQNETYLVWAYRTEGGNYSTGICTLTKLLSKAKKELDFLNNIVAKSKTAKISGDILNIDTLMPVENVKVKIRNILPPNQVFTLTTDKKGSFEIEAPAGKYTITPIFPTNLILHKISEGEYNEFWEGIELKAGGCLFAGFSVENKK